MKVYLDDGKKSVDPRLHLKRFGPVGLTDRNHCDSDKMCAENAIKNAL